MQLDRRVQGVYGAVELVAGGWLTQHIDTCGSSSDQSDGGLDACDLIQL